MNALILPSERKTTLNAEDIRRLVETKFDLPAGATRRRTNAPRISHARHVAMFLQREYLAMSLPAIGRQYGGWHHSTVMHALKHVRAAIEHDERSAEFVRDLRHAIETAPPKERAHISTKLVGPTHGLFA